MKKTIWLCGLLFCLMLTSCYNSGQSIPNLATEESQVPPPADIDFETQSGMVTLSSQTPQMGDKKQVAEAYLNVLLSNDMFFNYIHFSNGEYSESYWVNGAYLSRPDEKYNG